MKYLTIYSIIKFENFPIYYMVNYNHNFFIIMYLI